MLDPAPPADHAALSRSALDPSHVSPLTQFADIGSNQPQMQAVVYKVNEIINALRRF